MRGIKPEGVPHLGLLGCCSFSRLRFAVLEPLCAVLPDLTAVSPSASLPAFALPGLVSCVLPTSKLEYHKQIHCHPTAQQNSMTIFDVASNKPLKNRSLALHAVQRRNKMP